MAAIEKVVRRLRWRIRAQIALRHGLLGGAIGLFVFAVLVVLVKVRALPTAWLWVGGAVAVALPAAGIALGLARRLGDIALAAALDASGGLHSRLGSALAFARLPERTPMQEAAVEDALGVIARARPAATAPWRWGAFAAAALALAVALALTAPAVFVFEVPVGVAHGQVLARVVVPPPCAFDKAAIRDEDKERLETLAEALEEETKVAADERIKRFLDELNDLIRALQEGRISPEDAHARLAALEKALEAWQEEHLAGAEEAEERLAAAAEKARRAHEELRPMLEALKEQDLREAAEALEGLREKLREQALNERDIKKIAKDLEELADAIESERQKERDRLKKERDRLKDKEAREKDRFAKRDRDRLKDTERRLEQLDDEAGAMSEPQRQLERLSDELSEAAQDMLRRLAEALEEAGGDEGPQAEQRRQQAGQEGQEGQDGQGGAQGMTREELERAIDTLERMARQGQGRKQMRVAQGRMVDVREMMRRGQAGQGGDEGQRGQEAGRDGQGGEDGDAARRFEEGARGEGQDPTLMLGEGPGEGGEIVLLGQDQGKGGVPLPGKGQGGGDPALGQDGIGEGHDPNVLGNKTGLDAFEVQPDFVPGMHGEGPSKTKVVMSAAQKGFASRAYREVHQDYAGVVEDALEKEHIPPGKRTYVRRYFDLIRPR